MNGDPLPDAALARRVPLLLARARALLRLPGGPSDRLGAREIAPAAAAVNALHLGLVGARSLARPDTYDVRAHLGAYLLWWWPQSYAKVRAALRLCGHVPGPRVLDLGAGPAPGALAALDALAAQGGAKGEALAIDASAAALEEASALAASDALHAERWRHGEGPLPLRAAEQFELIVAAHLLSELPGGAQARAALLGQLAAQHLAKGGVLLLVEPALRETGRALLEVRDLLVSAKDAPLRALAPCLTQRPCPALASAKDWCTAQEAWTPPPHLVQLAQATGLRADEALSFAPLALGHEAPAPPEDLYRVVGVPRPEKGKARVFVCSDAGRVAAVRLDKERSAATFALEGLGHGDLVQLRGATSRGDGLRLGPGSSALLVGRAPPASTEPAPAGAGASAGAASTGAGAPAGLTAPGR